MQKVTVTAPDMQESGAVTLRPQIRLSRDEYAALVSELRAMGIQDGPGEWTGEDILLTVIIQGTLAHWREDRAGRPHVRMVSDG